LYSPTERFEKGYVLQAEMLGDFKINTAHGIVKIGVCGIDGYIVLDSLSEGSLHIGAVAHTFPPTKEERVVSYDEIVATIHGFLYHGFCDVKAQ